MATPRARRGSTSELVAVVDLGSTAVRLLLARIRPNAGYRVLLEERVPTRLGGGAPGTLPRRAIDQTLRAVHRFFARYAQNGQGPRVVAVATSAVRDARNRERLLAPLRFDEGIDVQVLTARDEARLGASAALQSLPFTDGVVADLGGTSLQLSRVRDRAVVGIASLPLGAVRTSRRFLRREPFTPRGLQALRNEIREQLAGAQPPAQFGDVMVGLGGTVRTLASIHLRSDRGDRKHRHGLRLHLLLGQYVRALVLLALITFVVWSAAFLAAGVPYALVLAGIGGALEFIPVIGPLSAGVVAIGVCLFAGYDHPWLLAVFILVWRGIQDYNINPFVMARGIDIHPALVIVGVLAGGEVAGVAGMFLSVP